MELISNFFNGDWLKKGAQIAICIAIGILVYYVIESIINKYANGSKFKHIGNKKIQSTYINLIKGIIKYAIILLCILVILNILKIDVTSVVAGVGVMGAAFIFAIQDFLKDIIRGSSIISNDYFQIGDIVKYKDIEGRVLSLSLKTTKIEVLKTQNIMSIANRNIDEIEVVSKNIYINIPLPYELKVKDAEKVINQAIKRIKKLELVEDSKYLGTNKLDESSILYLIKVECNPKYKLQANRDCIREILLTLEENNISVPYNQLDIHQK